eukprot:469928-Pyramimonas_sp.AAC.1
MSLIIHDSELQQPAAQQVHVHPWVLVVQVGLGLPLGVATEGCAAVAADVVQHPQQRSGAFERP